jgi:hypothetical protein
VSEKGKRMFMRELRFGQTLAAIIHQKITFICLLTIHEFHVFTFSGRYLMQQHVKITSTALQSIKYLLQKPFFSHEADVKRRRRSESEK